MSSLADAAAFASMRLIAVGSTNPVKLAAARAVIARVAAEARGEPVKVSSTVSDQPFGGEEPIRGAGARGGRARSRRSAWRAREGFLDGERPTLWRRRNDPRRARASTSRS